MYRAIALPFLISYLVCKVNAIEDTYNFNLWLPSHIPPWAEKLSPQLAGFSLEMDRWQDWAGKEVGKPNKYFNQLLHNLGERTGHMPFLRVGANSQDRATVDLDVEVMKATFPDPTDFVPNPEADHIFIGRDFYALSANLPPGTPFMWGLNLKSLNITETAAQARLLANTFQGSRSNLTKHVKLGPTRSSSFRGPYGPKWNTVNYSLTWVKAAKAVMKEIDFSAPATDKPTLSPGALTGFLAPEWTPAGPLQADLLDDDDILQFTSQFTEHSYSGGFSPNRTVRPGELMNKISVRANMSSKAEGIRVVRAMGLDYILGETNSYANHGQPGLSNTVEGAIWMTDWMLLGASLGIQRMYFHHGVGFRYNAIQPTDKSDDGLNITHPHILPSYHAFLIVNEAIGKSGKSYVAEIPTANITLTAYGIWEDQELVRVVVLNTQVYLEGEGPSINVAIGGKDAGCLATLKLLQSEKTTAHTGVTWAGQNFEGISGIPEGEVRVEEVSNCSFTLPASSIGLLEFVK